MDKDTLEMARRNYGYGRWDAPYWFIGPQQGMGRHENSNLRLRVKAWQDLGRVNEWSNAHFRPHQTAEPHVIVHPTPALLSPAFFS
jgi:hypothetical protein